MPLISIRSISSLDANQVSEMLTQVRDEGANALKCSPNNIWVEYHAIAPGNYLQGSGKPALTAQADTHPPIVILRAQTGRTAEEKTALVNAITQAIGRGLSVPTENIWLHYQEMSPKDVWFGDRWSG